MRTKQFSTHKSEVTSASDHGDGCGTWGVRGRLSPRAFYLPTLAKDSAGEEANRDKRPPGQGFIYGVQGWARPRRASAEPAVVHGSRRGGTRALPPSLQLGLGEAWKRELLSPGA